MIRVGIIGLGAVGERLLKQFLIHPKTEVKAICDSNLERLQRIKKELQKVEIYNDYKELLLNPEIDLVYVAVPPKFHHEIVLATAKSGKHILCEKPLANSNIEAQEMLKAVNEAGVIHAINFPLAYNNAVRELKKRVTEKTIGEIKRIDLTMHFPNWPRTWQQNPWIGKREQGGFIREITPHYLQIIIEMFGDIKHVQSNIEYPTDPYECETGVIARLELLNGNPILIDGLSGIGRKEEISFKLYGDQGTIGLKNWSVLEGESRNEDCSVIEVPNHSEHHDLINEIVMGINGEKAHLVTFNEGLQIQRVLEQLLLSK